MTALRAVLLLGASTVAGIVGSAGGTASLISYPALLAAGFSGRELAGSNALKNMILGIADVTCCAVFIAFWRVDWAAVGPMAAGFLIGSMIGPSLTRGALAGSPRP
jgi:uncharacterized protein